METSGSQIYPDCLVAGTHTHIYISRESDGSTYSVICRVGGSHTLEAMAALANGSSEARAELSLWQASRRLGSSHGDGEEGGDQYDELHFEKGGCYYDLVGGMERT